MKWIATTLLALSVPAFIAANDATPLLLRSPAMNATHVVFVHAGDLWSVPRGGGEAVRLTTGIGTESNPRFSPDGSQVAFTGEYDGNVDVYVTPAAGGVPKRLTYHPGGDYATGWSPDGARVVFVSGRNSDSGRFARLFTVGLDGVFPEEMPLPMGYEAAHSPDGTRLAYVPLPRGFTAWKRYRGGMTTPIWIAKLADSSVERIPRDGSNDFNPMWIDDAIYFLSDRAGAITLFSYDLRTKQVQQRIRHDGLDIKAASAGPGGIVYEQFGALYFYELATGRTRPIPITINADLPAVRGRFEKVGERLTNASLSPTGVRAVFEARGEIVTVPAEKGDPRNLTSTPGIAERDPAWSPDGQRIAYFSDESGEYALHVRDQKGTGEVKKIPLGEPPSFFYSPTWSPDSRKIAFGDKRLTYWYVDLEKGTPIKVDSLGRGGAQRIRWSPDSRHLAYTRPLKSWFSAVFVYSLETARSVQVTDGLGDAGHPVFDASGKYLYFTASTDIGPRVFGFDMSSYPHRPTRSVYVCVLRKDLPSPLAPETDEEKPAEEAAKKADDDKAQEEGADKAETAGDNGEKPAGGAARKKEPPRVTIDIEGIGQRILALPIPARNVIELAAGKANVLFVIEAGDGRGRVQATVHTFDLEKRKLEQLVDKVEAFDVSANGEKMLYRQADGWWITPAKLPLKAGEGKLKTDAVEVYVDPRAEWKQMYRETWRIERDFFYDPDHHGLDLAAASRRYEPYLSLITHRSELTYLFQEMLGELSVGHLYVRGGDQPDPKKVPGGLLGADYRIENGRYRFARVYDGENWNPQLRAPLTHPGVNVKAGEYLLAVRGRPLTARDNVYAAFENTADKQVLIRVGPNPDGTGARDVTVVPLEREDGLRNLAWIEENRRKVDRLSAGRLAYVYLPDTAQGGYTFFNRYFFSQTDKQGVIVDERFNSGGQSADYVIDYLRKPLVSHWAVRDGEDFRIPFGTVPGPKVMLVNEYSGSGGDLLPWMFRRAQLGPLVGKRTWGGLVGIGGYPDLIDGGSVTAPHFAFYSPEGQWEVENHGVAPDVEIDLDPAAWRKGSDVQLEKAVELALEALKKNPPPTTKRPPYPNYHGKKRQTTTEP